MTEVQVVLDQCFAMIGSNFLKTIDVEDYLATDRIVFGFMAANILNVVLKKQATENGILLVNIVAHFHEWASASGIMMMKVSSQTKSVATSRLYRS